MKFKNAKIRMLDLDLKGCLYHPFFHFSGWHNCSYLAVKGWRILVCHARKCMDDAGHWL